MDRMVSCVIGGRERWLNYSVAVMFEVNEKFGSAQRAMKIMEDGGTPGFETTRWLAVAMANDGELARREQGYDSSPMLKDSDISPRMHPLEYAELMAAVTKAICAGYRREVPGDENQEVDLGLQEIEAEKK